jgi:hypothetical protein
VYLQSQAPLGFKIHLTPDLALTKNGGFSHTIMSILVYAIWTEGDRVVDGCQNIQEHQVCQQNTQSLTPQKRKAEYDTFSE